MGERTDHLDDYDPTVEPLHGETAGFTEGNMTAGRDLTASDVGGGNVDAVDLEHEVDTDMDTNADDEDDPDQIRDDIADTRTHMSQTIDEIQERLSPQRLVEQAKDTVREATIGRAEQVVSDATDTAKSAGQGFLATIRENPLPAALAGIGLGWLIYKSRENMSASRPRYNDYRSYGPGYNEQAYRTRYRDDEENGPSVRERVQTTAGQMTDQAQQVASQAGEKVQQAASQVQDTAGQFADQAQYQAQRAQSWLERSWDENPLAVGALALAAGAVIGLSLPETEPENRLMGSTRDDLMQKAQTTAQDTVQKVQAVAQQATDAAKDAAQQEAKDQGLTQQNQA